MKKNLKKLLLLMALVSTAVICFAFSASALDAKGQCGDSVYWDYNSKTKELVISGSGAMYDYYMSSPFYGSDIEILTINDNVTSIGNYNFANCSKLRELTMPVSAKIVGYSFDGCYGIKKITLTKGTSVMESFKATTGTSNENTYYTNTPWYISKCSTIVIEDGVSNIGAYAFYDCTSLTNIIIPDSIKWIESYAFGYCWGLKELALPASAKINSDTTFKGCHNLDKITLTEGTGEMQPYSDYSSSAYTNYKYTPWYINGCSTVVIGEGVKNIGQYAFYDCTSLKNITIGKDVKAIDSNAFKNCTGITNVYAYDAESWLNIAFSSLNTTPMYYAKNLYLDNKLATKVTIPNSIKTISSYAFYNCGSLTSVTIPNSVTSIGSYAFYNCSSLTVVAIPDSVTSVGSYALAGCKGLTSITLPFIGASLNGTSNTHFGYIFGADSYSKNNSYVPTNLKEVIINAPCKTIGPYAFKDCTSLTAVTIPNSVTNIANGAFYGCSSLSGVTISNSVTSINEYTFYNCVNIKNIIIPEKVTWIGQYAFNGCKSLESVEIPDGVKSIGAYAFYACNKLANVIIGEKVTSIDKSAFRLCEIEYLKIPASAKMQSDSFSTTCLKEVYISVGTGEMADNRGDTPWCRSGQELKNVTLEDGIKNISNNAFSGCSGLTDINLPKSVTSIGNHAFSGCSGLTDINLPESVTSIGSRAFSGCSGLAGIIIPEGVTAINDYTFSGCSGIVDIQIPEAVKSFGKGAFAYCTNLVNININEGTTQIPSGMFENCISLERVVLPNSVRGVFGFSGCTGLKYLQVPIFAAATTMAFAFSNVTNLEEIVITPSEDMTEIDVIWDETPWYLCRESVKKITIEDGITEIGGYAFYECAELETVVIPDSVKSIGDSAFENCQSLVNITIPESVTAIGSYAFCNIGLTTVNYEGAPGKLNGYYGVEINYYYGCPHSKQKVLKAVAPTCTKSGLAEGSKCSRCGKVVKNQTTVDALTHYYASDYTVDKEATCSEVGSKSKHCTRSGCNSKTGVTAIAKLAHTYSNACDANCNVCSAKRTPSVHVYDNSCDTSCNVCSATRSINHTYSNACDASCNVCKATRSIKHTYKTTTTKATLKKNGKQTTKCTVCGNVSKTTTVYYPKTIKLEYTSTSYNGKAQKPKVTVKDSKGKTVSKDNYTVKYAKDCKNPGKYTVTVTFKGKYSGTKKLTFTIKPKKVTLSKVTAGTKQLTATWKTVTGATGYEVMYSTSDKFSSKTTKTATVKKGTSKKTTIKKLTKGKKYYVKVRAYKTVDGKKIYGAWSAVKNVKVK